MHDVVNVTPTTFTYRKRGALSTISQNSEHLQKRSPLTNSIPDSAEKSNSFSEKSLEKSSDGGKSSLADCADREALTSAFYELAETDAELQIVEKYRSEIDVTIKRK